MLGMKKDMGNQKVADLLTKIAAAFEVKDEQFFRLRAYQNAATSIEHLTSDIKDIWQEGKLDDISGVGANLAGHLDELFRTGKVKHFEAEVKGLPKGMFELLELEGVGAKTAYRLAKELKLENAKTAVEELKKALEAGKVEKIEGFGELKQKEILKAVGMKKIDKSRLLLPEAERLAKGVVEYLKSSGLVGKVEVLGSLRRRSATVGDIDLAVETDKPAELMEYLLKFSEIRKVLSTGPKTTMFVHKSGRQVDVKTQEKAKWGSILQHYTGSKLHNIHLRKIAIDKGMSLSEHGIKRQGSGGRAQSSEVKSFETEKGFYEALGMDYVPPELREDVGEIEVAIKRALPDLVEIGDIKGDLHVHTNLEIATSHDGGSSSVKELVKKAEELEYEYLGLADHNPKLSDLSASKRLEVIKRRNEAIEQELSTNESGVKILKGLEVDIRSDGELAISDEMLQELDYAIVSIHSGFRQSKSEATKRILAALAHPKVKIWGHPTGRLLNQREGLDYDWEKVFEVCKSKNIMVEINASPSRLDLPDVLVRDAVKRGVKLIINTDSHDKEHLRAMKYGVWVARRGWAEKKDIANTLGWKEFAKLVKK